MSTVHLGAAIETETAEALRKIADANERSMAAEIRLALRAHVEQNAERAAA